MMYMAQAKGSSERAMGKHLKNSLKYILNPEKTRMGTLIGGNHVLPEAEYAFQQMLETKKVMEKRYGYQKTKGRQGYHFVLSFSPKDLVTPEMALEITEKFVKAYIPNYESVFAVHDNTEKIHSHIVFNSVDMVNGYKFHTKNTEWQKRLQPIVNQLCKEYGLSTIDIPDMDRRIQEPISLREESAGEKKKQNKNYAQWKEEKEAKKTGKKSKKELIMEEIWECLHLVKSRKEFEQEMKKRGYMVTRKKKDGGDLAHTAVLPPGRKKNIRLDDKQEAMFKSLPEEYSRKQKKEKKLKQEHRSFQVTKIVLANASHSILKQESMDRMDGSESGKEEQYSENSKYEEKQYKQERNVEGKRKEKIAVSVRSGMRKIICARKMQQSNIVIQALSMKYILYDYRKRKYGKYYREYVKFSVIQQKVKYLHANNIKTMEQLEQRREDLKCLQGRLGSQKKEIFLERRQYATVFRLYEELEKLRLPVKLYREGDAAFSKEYNRMRKIIEKIKQTGLSITEVQEQYAEFKQRLSSIGKIERMTQKEIALCEEIWQENIAARQKEKALENNTPKKTEKINHKVR